MKFETLILRYKNLGYVPKNVDDEIELEFLINWIYKRYDVYIFLSFHDFNHVKSFKKLIPNINKFIAHRIWNCSKEYANTMYSDKYFDEPFDAKFYTVKEIYGAIKFQFH